METRLETWLESLKLQSLKNDPVASLSGVMTGNDLSRVVKLFHRSQEGTVHVEGPSRLCLNWIEESQ
jgi:hypothetical protein